MISFEGSIGSAMLRSTPPRLRLVCVVSFFGFEISELSSDLVGDQSFIAHNIKVEKWTGHSIPLQSSDIVSSASGILASIGESSCAKALPLSAVTVGGSSGGDATVNSGISSVSCAEAGEDGGNGGSSVTVVNISSYGAVDSFADDGSSTRACLAGGGVLLSAPEASDFLNRAFSKQFK